MSHVDEVDNIVHKNAFVNFLKIFIEFLLSAGGGD